MKARTLGLLVAAATVFIFLPLCVTNDEQVNTTEINDNKDAQVDPVVEEPTPSIVMLSRDGCPPCDRWEAECAADLRASGWHVAVDKGNFKGLTPTFVVTIAGEKFYKTGYSSKAKFYAWLRSLTNTKPKAGQTEARPSAKSCKPRKRVFGRTNLLRRRR
jgi:hypothetical protein